MKSRPEIISRLKYIIDAKKVVHRSRSVFIGTARYDGYPSGDEPYENYEWDQVVFKYCWPRRLYARARLKLIKK